MTKKKRILTIGSATEDIFLDYQEAQTMLINTKQGQRSCLVLPEGSKIEINDLAYTTGGGATNSAVSFERQGFDVLICTKVGLDAQGQYIRQELIAQNIDTKSVSFHESTPTGLSCIIKAPSGNHTILAYRGANTTMTSRDIPFDLFKQMDQLYVTSLSGKSSQQLIPIIEKAHEVGIPVALNPGTSQLASCTQGLCQTLPAVDILILNAEEAHILLTTLIPDDPAKFSIQHYFRTILARGTRIAVVTDGAKGVHVATKDTIYFHKSLPATVINTVGAGDAFGSTFVGSLASDYTIKESIVRGIINAVSVISSLNAKNGLLSEQELDKRLQEVGVSGIDTTPLAQIQ